MSCVEELSSGRPRPTIEEKFPSQGTAGHVAWLRIDVRHAAGESVYPAGFELNVESEEAKALTQAGFLLPDDTSLVQPRITRSQADGTEVKTSVEIPFVPLPKEAGRISLRLPPLPIDFASASGRVDRLCTTAHEIEVNDPGASTAELVARPDPEPRPQEEVWTTARDLVTGLLVAVPLVVALVLLLRRLAPKLSRPKKTPPPPLPWETALAELRRIENEKLLESERFEEHLDRVSDALRAYLGHRYGFDGLESTTRELLRQLMEKASDFAFEREVRTILHRADLVKFAKKPPESEECRDAFRETLRIVEGTVPPRSLDPRASRGGVR